MEKATFAAGCFWGIEEYFRKLEGVHSTQVGYTGGQTPDPNYEEVCRGDTGHAEAVEIIFDTDKINFKDLLTHFFQLHDPTTLNRQGPDVGSQYRSAIFFHNSQQQELALKVIDVMNESSQQKNSVVTQVVEAKKFYDAEEYHQCYIQKQSKDL